MMEDFKGRIGTVSYTHLDVYKRQAVLIVRLDRFHRSMASNPDKMCIRDSLYVLHIGAFWEY